MPQWMLLDGNHRVAAAAIRNDTHVDVIICGDWDLALSVLVDGNPWP